MTRHGIVVVGLLASFWVSAGMSTDWTINSEKSRLGFVATFEGAEFDGEFRRFDGTVRFEPESLQDSAFDIAVDVASADTGSRDLNEGMALPDWFHLSRYPRATFVSSSIEKRSDGGYLAVGTLDIKGIRKTVRLPFSWQRTADTARISGDIVLQRTQFNLGQGEWRDVSVVGDPVRVWADLFLTRAP